jgi:hypothetical protein
MFKTKTNITKKDLVYLLIIINIIIWSNSYVKAKSWYNDYINIAVAQANYKNEITEGGSEFTPPIGSKEWVLWYVEKEGLDPVKVNCLIAKESGWNPNAVGINASSADIGLYQFNTKFQIKPGFLTLDCASNVECSTYKFIEKVKKDKSFGAWHAYTNHCLWLGADPFIN